MTPGQQYQVTLIVPSPDAGSSFGLQAIDGATLSAPMTVTFTAGAAPSPPAAGPPTIEFCRDILKPIFLPSCAYMGCHEPATPVLPSLDGGSGYARLGLDLSSPQGVRATALDQVADESNTGPLASVETQFMGEPFGIDMAVIAPGDPGNSWLMYKTLLASPAPPNAEVNGFDAGNSDYDQNIEFPGIAASERAILSNYVLGQSMPYPYPVMPEATTVSLLTNGDLERLSLWIAQGAITPASCP